MAYSCTKCSEVGDVIQRFDDDVRIPDILRSDMAPGITGKHKDFQDQVKRLCIYLAHSEVEWYNWNHAE